MVDLLIDGIQFHVTVPIPEPSVTFLAAFALAGLFSRRQRTFSDQ